MHDCPKPPLIHQVLIVCDYCEICNHCTISCIHLKWKTNDVLEFAGLYVDIQINVMLIFKIYIYIVKYNIVQMQIVLYMTAASICGGAWNHYDDISCSRSTLSCNWGSAAFHFWMSCQFLVVEIWQGGITVSEKPQEGQNVLSHWLHSNQEDTLKDLLQNRGN